VRVQVDERQLLLALAVALPPHPPPPLVDARVEPLQLGFAELPQKVARRRRIRQPLRAQQPAYGVPALQISDVLDAPAADVEVVDMRQHVVRLAERSP
jgi:hypothetical protein